MGCHVSESCVLSGTLPGIIKIMIGNRAVEPIFLWGSKPGTLSHWIVNFR